jgi:hypothetical protein
MKNVKVILAGIAILLLGHCSPSYGQENDKAPLKYYAAIMTGYNRGFGIQANITAYNFPKDFPLELRLGIGLSFLDPGNAADARRIFINNATNGVPEKNGRSLDLRFDFLFPKTVFGNTNSFLILGPRFSTFRGHFDYVDGNEVFDITSAQWGVGAGIENHFKLTHKLSLLLNYGLDVYLPSTLTGHDTSYSPNNDNVNAEENNQNNDNPFTYKDANKAIRQPFLMPHLMIGVNFNL